MLRDNKNAIRTSLREIDREERQIEKRRKEVEAKIKKSAQQNRIGEVKIFAKDLVRIKKAIEKFEMAKANLQGIQIQLMTASGQEAIVSSMKNACKSYKMLNGLMDPKAMQKIMAEYQKESMKQEIMSEVMEGTMDDALGSDQTAEDELVDQVLQEIGVSVTGNMGDVPTGEIAQPAAAATESKADDITNRLNNL